MKKSKLSSSFLQEAANALDQEYRCFLDYIASNNVKLSARTGNFGKQDCAAINQLFRLVKEPYETAGRSQEYYGVIDFFYYFSWYADILREVKRKGGGHTLQTTDRCTQFLEMPPIERYLLMLTVWFFYYRNDSTASDYDNFLILDTIMGASEGKMIVYPYSHSDIQPWWHTYFADIRIFALFGFLQISWLEENAVKSAKASDNKYRIHAMTLTKAGALWKETNGKMLRDYEWYTKDGFLIVLDTNGSMADSYDEKMKNRLLSFWDNPAAQGQHTIQLKVSVGSCVRRIRLDDECTLDLLHYYIQKSVDFDMSHLYYFQIGGGSRRRRYYAPQCDEEEYLADNITLAELHLYEGMQFQYLFDFGDEWLFQIKVEQILDEKLPDAEIINVSGENPEQYAW